MLKKKTVPQKAQPKSVLFTLVLVLLPFVALVPLIFDPPFFIDTHLPTKEIVYFVAAFVVSGVATWRFFRRPAPFAVPRAQFALLATLAAFFAWQMISLVWAPNFGYGLRDAGMWLGVGIFLVLGRWGLNARSAVWLQYSLAAVSLILSVTQIIEFAKGNPSPSIFFNFGMTAELLAVMLPLQVAAGLSVESRLLAVVSVLSAGLGWLALCETLRRGPLLGALLGLLIVGAAMLPKVLRLQNWRRLASAASAMLLVTALHFGGFIKLPSAAAPPTLTGQSPLSDLKMRVQDATGFQAPLPQTAQAGEQQPTGRPFAPPAPTGTSSLGARVRLWVVGWEMAKRHPLTGVGVAGYPAEYMTYHRFYLENPSYAQLHQADVFDDEYGAGSLAHNEYVQILAELGFIGLLLFLAWAAQLAWQLWRNAWKAQRTLHAYLPLGALAGLVAFAVSSTVSNFSFRQVPSTVIAVSLMGIGLMRLGNDEAGSEEPQRREVVLSKAAVAAVLCVTLALSALFAWHAYHAMQSQRLQAEPDLMFSPKEPAKNEAWLAQYREALDHDPYNFGAHFGCGLLLYQMKRPQEAVVHLEAANRLGYRRPFTDVLLAFAYEQTGRMDDAVKLLQDSLASYPKSLLARAVYVEFLRKKGELAASRRELELLQQQNEMAAKCLPLVMRMKPVVAVEEARRQHLYVPPYDVFPEPIDRAMLQMRTFHYLNETQN